MSYGHDIFGAIHRGHMRRAEECIHDAMLHCAERHSGGKEKVDPRFMFSGALAAMYKVAARMGMTAMEIRKELEDDLVRSDSLSIERTVEKWAHMTDQPGGPDGPDEFYGQGPCTHCQGTSYEPKETDE